MKIIRGAIIIACLPFFVIGFMCGAIYLCFMAGFQAFDD